jgi:LysR family transcriptional activator of nhaA
MILRENDPMPKPAAERLNYHHLLYFWTAAREGSIGRAARSLGLAQPTISGQIRELERRLGHPLFRRQGRQLVLTDVGRTAFDYAEEIFAIGRELLDVTKGRLGGRPLRFTVGITDDVPKLIAYRLLEPALRLAQPLALACREGPMERLLADLALHELDVVIADSAIPARVAVKGFSHLLGQCGVTIFAAPALAARHRRGFPGSLDGAPMLLPTHDSVLRRSLDPWFEARGIQPHVAGEFADSALLKVFGQAGRGLFAGSTVIEREIGRQYGVRVVGRVPDVIERFYAISIERRLEHPAVIALAESARDRLFG